MAFDPNGYGLGAQGQAFSGAINVPNFAPAPTTNPLPNALTEHLARMGEYEMGLERIMTRFRGPRPQEVSTGVSAGKPGEPSVVDMMEMAMAADNRVARLVAELANRLGV